MNWDPEMGTLRVAALGSLYRSHSLTPSRLIEVLYHRIAAAGEDRVWIHLVPMVDALKRAHGLESGDTNLPLYGIPFAVKDNIDVEGLPTTAGCPAFSYVAERSAKVVEKLLAAGAILIGKTNMDQFATGLVGVRSPYGVPKNPFDERYIPGVSSSGSAVAVAKELVSFSLGTDTAGSGRVPAAFNNIVGWKPTPGLVSIARCGGVFLVDDSNMANEALVSGEVSCLEESWRPVSTTSTPRSTDEANHANTPNGRCSWSRIGKGTNALIASQTPRSSGESEPSMVPDST